MPLLRFDLIEGRSEAGAQGPADAAHRAMLAAFKVPERDRYQIVQQHKRSQIVEDTGLGIERSDKIVFLQVITRSRDRKLKEAFYRLLCEALARDCGIAPSDVVVSMVENFDEDWSFGLGRAQFLTCEPSLSGTRAALHSLGALLAAFRLGGIALFLSACFFVTGLARTACPLAVIGLLNERRLAERAHPARARFRDLPAGAVRRAHPERRRVGVSRTRDPRERARFSALPRRRIHRERAKRSDCNDEEMLQSHFAILLANYNTFVIARLDRATQQSRTAQHDCDRCLLDARFRGHDNRPLVSE